MQKLAEELLMQIEAFVSNQSTNIITHEELFDSENWEEIPKDRLSNLVQKLCASEKLLCNGDTYTVQGSGHQKMNDYARMMSGGWS